MKYVLVTFMGALIFVAMAMLNGFWFSTIWNWIAVPALHAPPVTPAAAVGLRMAYHAVRGNPFEPSPKDEREPALVWINVVGFYVLTLTVAWVAKQFL